jgi:hypothetical protein
MYAVYMAALVVGGLGLHFGLFPGDAPVAMTLVPAILGAVVIAVVLLLGLVSGDLERRLATYGHGEGTRSRWLRRAASVPATVSAGVRDAIDHVRHGDPSLVGALAYWGFNVAVLWASFHAFGQAPPFAVIVMAYFVGMLGNLLPLPGGIGGVDGGMIGAFLAFGVPGGLAVVAVLVYRGFAFWLPTIPGAIAYFQLRRTVRGWKDAGAAPHYT